MPLSLFDKLVDRFMIRWPDNPLAQEFRELVSQNAPRVHYKCMIEAYEQIGSLTLEKKEEEFLQAIKEQSKCSR
jgi:hypothetical protein